MQGERSFLEEESIDLSSKISVTCGGNISHYKSVHHRLSTLPLRIENTLAVFKTNHLALL